MPTFIPLIATSALATWGVAGGTALTIFGTTLSLVSSFLVRTAIGLALYALTPKGNESGGVSGYGVTATGSALDHQCIYGRTKIAGVRLYDSVTGSGKYLNRIIGFAGHEVTSYDEVWFNDELLTIDGSGDVTAPSHYVGKAKVFFRYGLPDQAYMAELSDYDHNWTSEHKLSGIAYIYVRLTYDSNSYPNGIPEIKCIIKGKPVYDPRTGLTSYSNNPALCLRDYLKAPYGLAVPDSEIDDTRIQVAANICDETLEGEKRYICNGAFNTSATPLDILTNIVGAMAGTMWYAQGKWRCLAGKYVAPTLSLTADDFRSPLTVSTRHSRRDNYNTVKGRIAGPNSNWNEADFPAVTDNAFLDADNGQEQAIDIVLPFTTSVLTAQRIARIMLRRNRQQLTVKASFGLKAFKCQIGEIVSLTYPRFGWTNKEFEVSEWSFNPQESGELLIDLTLREISSDVFTDVPGILLERDNTTLGNPFAVDDIGLTVRSDIRVISENVTNVLVVTTSASTTSIDYVEVQVQKAGAINWVLIGSGLVGDYEYPVADVGLYNIRARGVNYLGVKGEWTTITDFPIDNVLVRPSDVPSLSSNVSGQHTTLDWPAIPDGGLSYYTVRHSARTVGGAWQNSTVLAEKVPRPATSVTVPYVPGTYMVKAVDKLGNESNNAAMLVIPVVPERSTVLTQTESSGFSGTKSNTSVTTGNLRLTTYSTAPATGTYTFSSYIDTGAVRDCQVRIDLWTSLFSSSSSNWDDLVGNWDSWSGNWDSWGSSVIDGNTDVKMYISTTDDNPAGSPTWTPYVQFKGGNFKARAFRFYIELSTKTSGFTPSIDFLQARVEYN